MTARSPAWDAATATVTFLLHHRPVSKVVKAGGGLLVRQRFPRSAATDRCKGDPAPAGSLTGWKVYPGWSVVIGRYAWGVNCGRSLTVVRPRATFGWGSNEDLSKVRD